MRFEPIPNTHNSHKQASDRADPPKFRAGTNSNSVRFKPRLYEGSIRRSLRRSVSPGFRDSLFVLVPERRLLRKLLPGFFQKRYQSRGISLAFQLLELPLGVFQRLDPYLAALIGGDGLGQRKHPRLVCPFRRIQRCENAVGLAVVSPAFALLLGPV